MLVAGEVKGVREGYRPGYVPGKAKVMFYLAEDVARELRVESALTRESQSEIAEQAIRRELERRRAEREGRSHVGT